MTVAISLWRNDVDRGLLVRAKALLAKTGVARWIWLVGDSTDDTEIFLRVLAHASGRDVTVVRADTGIVGDDSLIRLRRMSRTFNVGLDAVRSDDTYVLHCESDLETPVDIVEQLLASGYCPAAAWPVLGIEDPPVFYDTWAFRGLDGIKYINHPPYHREYRAEGPFEVSSAGSCWLYYAADIRAGVRCYTEGVVELSQKFRALGRRIWVLPHVVIHQPVKTWTPYAHPS